MDEDLPFPPFGERDLDLFRVHFYDFLQQVILRELGVRLGPTLPDNSVASQTAEPRDG